MNNACDFHFCRTSYHLRKEALKKTEHVAQLQSFLSDSHRGEFDLRAIPMVASQCLAMGNGSIKAPRAEENSCPASIHTDPPGLDTDVLRSESNLMNICLLWKIIAHWG